MSGIVHGTSTASNARSATPPTDRSVKWAS